MAQVILECNDIEVIKFDVGIIPRIGETISVKEGKEITKYKIKNVEYPFKYAEFSGGFVTENIIITGKKIEPSGLGR